MIVAITLRKIYENTKGEPIISESELSFKRTTIYLPTDIFLTQPTFEINQRLRYLPTLLQIVKDQGQYIRFYKSHFFRLKGQVTTKPCQIIIEGKHWAYINDIQKLTGLNNSQIATLCFWSIKNC
ncbi:hypothetical protein [Schinkia azotoformans]|uniref:hypothetical protein n=1 Tax=Schinkia azotoformans TaxID=1454 RepID=UPI002DBB95B7|nr:hypothetical protein [Schinkia azotoformans]MEC1715550.1 hypothetical protein [Schinkia azotoformans]MEC1743436.1 hypothetical protein [Schinkia azotoformans]MEC1768378.1 hypothetical protein [Schinkia azotoformans]MEC1781539.1 hypothetical protein [Schinkia azotoformans]MEC1787913.1 hypothetical protein [Schinkia azotoformans]